MKNFINKKKFLSVIEADLGNGYTVFAMKFHNSKTKKYEVTLYIKDNSIDVLDLIEKQENIEFNVSKKKIDSIILKHISILLEDGFFNKYISRYKYMMDCFDKGNEIFEAEKH